MQAVVLPEGKSSISELKVVQVPAPPPVRPAEALVRIRAAGLNPVDWKIVEGQLKKMIHHEYPLIIGWDASGICSFPYIARTCNMTFS
ncbi:hypothetical protein Pelo_18121 [Pelomyxa schiedti]|nr:hypothetical protein Pelo_18121 [Pelomyxa schiedti]